MGIRKRGSGRGGGGGLHFRDPIDSFNGADIAAARTARDTYFTNNSGEINDFQQDEFLAIRLTVTGSTDNVFETYVGAVGDAYAAANWVDRTDAIEGNVGPQARYVVSVFRNATTAPTTPTGGSYVVSSGVLTPPIDWTSLPTAPATGENVYESQVIVNPRVDTGTLTPTWSTPVEPVEETAELAAAASATAAAASEAAAAASATSAATAETNAETAQTAAETAQTGAETAETNAETAETNAETAETGAETAQSRAEDARDAAESALQSSGAALAFHDFWSGDIDITTASQWKAVGTGAVPSNATWLIWNGGALSDDDDDGPAGQWTWINAAAWRALIADTVDTTPGDGTGMLIVEWASPDVGDGTPAFDRRDVLIGRTSADIPLITSTNASEDFYGASLLYVTQAVSSGGGGGGGASAFSELTGQIADNQVPAAFTRDTELAAYALLAGAVFTGAVSGITPTAAAHLSRKDYVDAADDLRALLAGAIFTGDVQGITPTAAAHMTRKDYVDTADGLRALLTGATFTGAVKGPTPVVNADLTTKAYVDGLIITPTHTTDQYLGVRADTAFEASDFTSDSTGEAYAANEHTATVPDSGLTVAYLAIARLATDPDLVYLDIDGSGVNSLGAFMKQTTTIDIGGESYEWWLSENTGTWDGLMIQAR